MLGNRPQIYRYGPPDPPEPGTYTSESMLHGEGLLTMGDDGWTVFEPSVDSRIMYVSEAGNDSTAQVYGAEDFADPFDPSGELAFSTYAGALASVRNGYPDWILFRRGDSFTAQIDPRPGRGASEYSIVGSYGLSGGLPILKPTSPSAGAALFNSKALEYSAVINIDFYHDSRDPTSASYVGIEGTIGFRIYSGSSGIVSSFMFEGCKFRFFINNEIQMIGSGSIHDVVIRRTSVTDNYAGSGGHSQGMFAANLQGILLEENVFDHNGWYSQAPGSPGTATIYNHNTYFENCHNVTYHRNVFLRPSSIHNKFTANDGFASSTNITLSGNLYVDGEVGLSLGGNVAAPYRWHNMSVMDNVLIEIGRSRPTNRTLAWGIDVVDWQGGVVRNNYILYNTTSGVDYAYGINLTGVSSGVIVENNVVYNLNGINEGTHSSGFRFGTNSSTPPEGSPYFDNVVLQNNQIVQPNHSFYMVASDQPMNVLSDITFNSNLYHSANEASAFRVAGVNYSLSQWSSQTGDTSTFGPDPFSSPRTIEGYMVNVGTGISIDDFITACRSQSRHSWDNRYMAVTVNEWIKLGFQEA